MKRPGWESAQFGTSLVHTDVAVTGGSKGCRERTERTERTVGWPPLETGQSYRGGRLRPSAPTPAVGAWTVVLSPDTDPGGLVRTLPCGRAGPGGRTWGRRAGLTGDPPPRGCAHAPVVTWGFMGQRNAPPPPPPRRHHHAWASGPPAASAHRRRPRRPGSSSKCLAFSFFLQKVGRWAVGEADSPQMLLEEESGLECPSPRTVCCPHLHCDG